MVVTVEAAVCLSTYGLMLCGDSFTQVQAVQAVLAKQAKQV